MKRRMPKRYLLILLFPLAYFINLLASQNNVLVEKYFSTGIYKGIAWVVGHLSGWIPFSVAEMLLPVSILIVIWRLIVLIKALITHKNGRWAKVGNFILNGAAAVSVVYFLFIMMWGLNYSRSSLPVIMDLEIRPSALEELKELTESLIADANSLRGSVTENEKGIMVPTGGYKYAFSRAKLGYERAAEIYPVFEGVYSMPKPLVFSPYIAYTHIWGIYSPFTVESNVNMEVPPPMILSTMMHEVAHQLGFAREDEANYIAYLTCSMHPDVDFQYAGALFALDYALSAVYRQDKDAYKEYYNALDEGIKRDLNENYVYQKKYEGPVKEVFTKSNDIYLKANNQKDGERSYGRMLDLMLARQRKYKKTDK